MKTKALPKTELGELGDLIADAQAKNMARQPRTKDGFTAKHMINAALAQASILVDVLRGDGQ